MNPLEKSGDSTLAPTWLEHDSWRAGLAETGPDILHAIVVEIEDVESADAGEPFAALLDAEDRARAARFRFTEDRNRFVIAHALLRLVASEALGARPDAIEFASNPRVGLPPRLVVPSRAPQLSLSHSSRYVAIALGRGNPVGIDIESPRPLHDIDALAATVFTETEVRDLAALPPALKERAFLRWWTAKEAVLKAQGTGFAIPPADVALGYDAAKMPHHADVPSGEGRRRYRVRVFDPFEPTLAVVAIACERYRDLRLTFSPLREWRSRNA